MDNIGFVKTHTVSIVEIGTENETRINVRSGEDMSSGATVIRGTHNVNLSGATGRIFLTT